MSVNTIGVIEAGVMDSGIAQVAATNGISVLLLDVNETAVKQGIEAVESRLNVHCECSDFFWRSAKIDCIENVRLS